MQIQHLRIDDFRAITSLDIDLAGKNVVVFAGVNGSGKSSILDCTAILLSRFTSRIRSDSLRGLQFAESDIRNESIVVGAEVSITLTNGQKDTWDLTKGRKGSGSSSSFKAFVAKQLRDSTTLPLVVYYSVHRVVIDIPLRIRTKHDFKPLDAYEGNQRGGSDFRLFFEWFRQREDLENEQFREAPQNGDYLDVQLQAVRHAITQILPGYENLRVKRNPLRMFVEKQGEKLMINQLSDGEKCLIAMVGDLARRLSIANPALSDPLKGAGVVLIDEIELHLHPAWQRTVVPRLNQTFPNCQFLLTTHSPQVLGSVKPDSIFLLNKEGVVRPESSFGRDSNGILEELMGTTERDEEIEKQFKTLFELIDDNKLSDARERIQGLEACVTNQEPLLTRANALIKRRELLRK